MNELEELPNGDTSCDRDIERMLGAELWNLETAVAEGNNLIIDAFDLVAENDGNGGMVSWELKLIELDAGIDLLNGIDEIALGFELGYALGGFIEILPIDGIFGAEGGFMDIAMRRGGTDTAEAYLGNTEGVGCAKYGADIVLAAHIVEDYHKGEFLGLFELLNADTVEFGHGEFFHNLLYIYIFFDVSG